MSLTSLVSPDLEQASLRFSSPLRTEFSVVN